MFAAMTLFSSISAVASPETSLSLVTSDMGG